VASTPNGADIEVDGSFVGSTPSTIGVLGGDHVISVKKNGYKPWERKIKTSTGKVTSPPTWSGCQTRAENGSCGYCANTYGSSCGPP
jgi:hypothetical protein